MTKETKNSFINGKLLFGCCLTPLGLEFNSRIVRVSDLPFPTSIKSPCSLSTAFLLLTSTTAPVIWGIVAKKGPNEYVFLQENG